MLEEVIKITDVVRHLLEIDPRCRDSDRRLILKVWETQDEDLLHDISFREFSEGFKTGAYASTESIRRSRQKLQEHNPDLRGRNYGYRQELEKEMRSGINSMEVNTEMETSVKSRATAIEAYRLMHEGTLALARAEMNGIRVDTEYLVTKYAHMDRQINYLDRKFKQSKFYMQWWKSQDAEPNPNSTVQLQKFLYETKKIKPPKETPTGRGSVDKESLATLNIPELNMLLEMRKLKKIQDYLDLFNREQVDGWLHPNFNLHLVSTFRSSSDRPNFQNIPKRDELAMKTTRRALFPRPGHQLLEVDYSGIEVRVAACYHKDPTMIKYLKEGFDMHGDMAKQLFFINEFDKHRHDHAVLRSATKNGFVFPEFYGDYFGNCAEYLACDWGKLPKRAWRPEDGIPLGDSTLGEHFIKNGVKSLKQYTEHVEAIEKDFWGKRFKVYARWKERWWHQYQKTGYVDLLTGFRCQGLMRKNDAINYPIQGAAFHCLLWAFIELDRYLQHTGLKSRIIGQIHDAIVLDVYPPEMEVLVEEIVKITTKDLPKAWSWIAVPLEVEFEVCDVDTPWSEKKELKVTQYI